MPSRPAPVTRTKLNVCRVKDCPWPESEEHVPWCADEFPSHRYRQGTHQHFPKKGMGGNNPRSKIVAILCWECHDRIDNGPWWGNSVESRADGRWYVAWKRWEADRDKRVYFIDRRIGDLEEAA